MTAWAEELNSRKPNISNNDYSGLPNRLPLCGCNWFQRRKLSVEVVESTASHGGKRDGGDCRCMLPALERFGRRKIAELEECCSGATRSASCLLGGHLFLHLLLHFLRCGFCLVGSDPP